MIKIITKLKITCNCRYKDIYLIKKGLLNMPKNARTTSRDPCTSYLVDRLQKRSVHTIHKKEVDLWDGSMKI
jgi:hypothetical protein